MRVAIVMLLDGEVKRETNNCGVPQLRQTQTHVIGLRSDDFETILHHNDKTIINHLGPPVVPFYPFFEEGSPTKIDYRKRVALF